MRTLAALFVLCCPASAAVIPLAHSVDLQPSALVVGQAWDFPRFQAAPSGDFSHSLTASVTGATSTTAIDLDERLAGFQITATNSAATANALTMAAIPQSQASMFFELTAPATVTFSADLTLGIAGLNRTGPTFQHLRATEGDLITAPFLLPAGTYQLYQNTSGVGVSTIRLDFAQAVPEPSGLILAALGLLALATRLRRGTEGRLS